MRKHPTSPLTPRSSATPTPRVPHPLQTPLKFHRVRSSYFTPSVLGPEKIPFKIFTLLSPFTFHPFRANPSA